jgi:hypothetical protein
MNCVIFFGVVMIESAAGVPPRRGFRYAGMDVKQGKLITARHICGVGFALLELHSLILQNLRNSLRKVTSSSTSICTPSLSYKSAKLNQHAARVRSVGRNKILHSSSSATCA